MISQHKILMGSDGVARISDYGLEIDLCDMASSESVLDDVRWMAPEVLGTKNKRVPPGDRGKSADIYSFAMVMFEVRLSRHCPRTRDCVLVSHP